MVKHVMFEAEKRKKLYLETGRGIRSLDVYNQVTGQNLPWIVMIIDECLYVMRKSDEIKDSIELAVSWAAKYGITVVIASQDFKTNLVGSEVRNNFSSRFQFLAEDKVQANILVKGCDAHLIRDKGRCFARLPGDNKAVEIQTPFVSETDIMNLTSKIQGRFQNKTIAPKSLPIIPSEKVIEGEVSKALEPKPAPAAKAKPKYHADFVNAAIDRLLTDNPDTFPTKTEVANVVGVSGGAGYARVLEVYNVRYEQWLEK